MLNKKSKQFKYLTILSIIVIVFVVIFSISNLKHSAYFTNRYLLMQVNNIFYFLGGGENVKQLETESDAVEIPVLLYHGIVDGDDKSNTSFKDFKDQMYLLKENGYKTISIKDFLLFLNGEKKLPKKSFLLTFDDGRKDSYYPVDPILKALDFNAVMFVITSRSLVDEHNFHLTKGEIKQMINSGRWEIQSHGENAHSLYKISEKGDLGHFYSNKLWLDDQNRLETDDEFRIRVFDDLKKSYDNIHKEFDIVSDSLAFPFGDFGEKNSNYENANEVILSEANKIYKMAFYQYWPRVGDGFRSNYLPEDKKSSNFIRKRINVSPSWTGNDLLEVMDATLSISLPYKEDFKNNKRWIDISGDVFTENGYIEASSYNGNSGIYLDGSYLWGNYGFEIVIKEIIDKTSILLLSRYKNSLNYTACDFKPNSISIKNVTNGKEEVLNEITTSEKYKVRKNSRLKMEVNNSSITCFIDDAPILTSSSKSMPIIGGVAIKSWNPEKSDYRFKINSFNAYQLESINSLFCKPDEIEIKVRDGNFCRGKIEPSIWLDIYDKYPLSNNGMEIAYNLLENGDLDTADKYFENYYPVERFKPFKSATKLTWREDPYQEPYWRFIFYSLQPNRHLTYAWKKTGNPIYKDKLIEITDSFLDNGMDGPYSWDLHGTAYRTMVLINTWWKLREEKVLPVNFGVKTLKALKIHGDFLAEEDNYESGYNHGFDQAMALFLLSVNFPDLPGSNDWRKIAENRLSKIVRDIVDDDGVLIENSPYYHFYALDKYWSLYKYLKNNNLNIDKSFYKKFEDTLRKMISYGTYILQPDLNTPTIGASLKSKISTINSFKEMSDLDPYFKYVLTEGKEGERPLENNVQYLSAGEFIMRSGWGKGDEFNKKTQLIFDIGDYRTDHSDLDALSFQLYSQGRVLLPDSGLYTYEEGPHRNYFHGTYAHNTIVVDGGDQMKGKVSIGPFHETKDFIYQSGQHNLYEGVSHQRSLAMIEDKYMLLIDNLTSEAQHQYEQMFHIFSGAKTSINGLNFTATGESIDQSFTISQLIPAGIEISSKIDHNSPIFGVCSEEYEIAVPCEAVFYKQTASTTSFITLIEIGKHDPKLLAKVSEDRKTITFNTSKNKYIINISKIPRIKKKVEKIGAENISESSNYSSSKLPTGIFNDVNYWTKKPKFNDSNVEIIEETEHDENLKLDDKSLRIITPDDNSYVEITKDVAFDLTDKNLILRAMVDKNEDLREFKLTLSNDNFKQIAAFNLKSDLFTKESNGEWLSVGLGKTEYGTNGAWEFKGTRFDWSKIDKIRFTFSSVNKNVTVKLNQLFLVEGQKEGIVSIVFDDGWDSIMNTLSIMNKYGFKGNIAVTKRLVGAKKYLSLDQIKQAQNVYGWNIINHSSFHESALSHYFAKSDMDGLEKDILNNLEYLEENNINSAPNWFIYPEGDTNQEIKKIVGKYYKFARTVKNSPEFFPFADPLAVKILRVYRDINPDEIKKAFIDAKEKKLTLVLMFHKLYNEAISYTDYDLQDFEDLMKDLYEKNIKVLTLSELDQYNNVPLNKFLITKESPEQIKLDFQINNR